MHLVFGCKNKGEKLVRLLTSIASTESRESEHPMKKCSGVWMDASLLKKSGSSALTFATHLVL